MITVFAAAAAVAFSTSPLHRPLIITATRASIPCASDLRVDSTDVASAAADINKALADDDDDSWDDRRTWALEDAVPKYSLEGGRVVLWRRITLEVPELFDSSAEELRSRWLALEDAENADADASSLQLDDPPSLDEWMRVGPGRYEGSLPHLPAMRVTIEHDSDASEAAEDGISLCSAYDADGSRRWVRTKTGELFQLGRPKRDEALMTPMEEDGIENMEEQDGGLGMAAPLEFARSLVTSGKFDPEAAKKAAGEAAGGLARAAGEFTVPPPAVLALGGMGLATAIGVLSHHIQVSVFIV